MLWSPVRCVIYQNVTVARTAGKEFERKNTISYIVSTTRPISSTAVHTKLLNRVPAISSALVSAAGCLSGRAAVHPRSLFVDQIHTLQVTASFEFGLKPCLQYRFSQSRSRYSAAQTQHVCIVMGTGHTGVIFSRA